MPDHQPLHYRQVGAGEDLLLIHGLGSSGADWAFQEAPLAAHFRLLMPDLRGCGRSAAGGVASIAEHARDLWALLDHLGIARVHVLGHSLGGAVALEMALQRPHAVARLMTINSLLSYRVDSLRKWLEVNGQLALVRVLGLKRTAGLVARRLFPWPHQAAMRERVIKVIGDLPQRAYLDLARALAGWCALERIGDLRAPMLMLAAEHDYTPLEEKRRFATLAGAELAVVAGSRHGTPFDAIEACNASALAWFRAMAVPTQLRMDDATTAPSAPPPGFEERELRSPCVYAQDTAEVEA